MRQLAHAKTAFQNAPHVVTRTHVPYVMTLYVMSVIPVQSVPIVSPTHPYQTEEYVHVTSNKIPSGLYVAQRTARYAMPTKTNVPSVCPDGSICHIVTSSVSMEPS